MSAVHTERVGDVWWARLDNPGRGNALSPDMVEQLRDLVDAIGDDRQVLALVLTGTGRSFCGGADVVASAELGDPGLRLEFIDSGRQLIESLAAAPVPVIAAVNGPAYAGGLELVLGCDIVVAAAAAQFGDLHLAHGRIPGWGGAAKLLQRCGSVPATELLLLGRRWDAATALARGLVTEVVPDGAVIAAVEVVLDQLRSTDRRVLRQMIALVRELPRRSPESAAAVEWLHFVRHFGVRDPGVVQVLH